MADEFLFPMTSRYSYSSSLYNGDSDGEFCEPGTCSAHVFTNPEYSSLTDRLGGKEAWRPTHFSWYQTFFCIFQKNSAMATLGLKEMGKFLLGSKTKLRQPTGQTFSLPSQRNFPNFLQTYGSHSKVHWENAKKSLVLWKVGWTPCLFSS